MKEIRYGGGSHTCNICGGRIYGSKLHRCPFPKEELEKYYKLYLQESEKYHSFKDWLESTDLYNYLGLAEKCKFSTTAELRKQLDILERKYRISKAITQSTKQSGYSVYIPENAKKQEETKVTREETTTWEDILVTISNFQSKDPHKMDLVDWLKKHYNVPTKKK